MDHPAEPVALAPEFRSPDNKAAPNGHGASPTLAHLQFQSVTQVLAHRARQQPDDLAFIHLLDGEREERPITYLELYRRAHQIMSALQPHDPVGRRVLLLFEAGIDYVAALFGVFLAGAVAVPSFPPVGSRALGRLGAIAEDSDPSLVLTNGRFSRLRERVLGVLPDHFDENAWLDIDALAPEAAPVEVSIPPVTEELALLQYTSGSTARPKGVMLSHSNLVSNCHTASAWMGGERRRFGCTWLPPYHDMGLMGGILQPIYEGFPTAILPPAYFVQRPLRWLQALSRYQVTVTIAPNFAFDLCCDQIGKEDEAGLDLSHLEDLYCGAEPIREHTFTRFSKRFSGIGFRPRAFGPCYGLAEATVFVTGKVKGSDARFVSLDKEALAAGTVRLVEEGSGSQRLASCGVPAPGHEVLIVDPQSRAVAATGKVGEIWVRGDNVGRGYWRQEAVSEQSFRAQLAGDSGDRYYMRTGDLGFLLDGELYVTGRLKDLIVIAGRNLYPQDIELCVEQSDPRLRANGVAALGMDDGDREQLVVVAEIKRSEKPDGRALAEIRQHIVEAVTGAFSVAPARIHLAPMGTIPLTTSGKIQRRATAGLLSTGELKEYPSS